MKKKTKVFATLLLLCFFLSSCVYSLFPIYTEESLVYLPELIGKWKTGEDPDDYILFERIQQNEEEDTEVNDEYEEASVYTDSIFGDGWKIKVNGPIEMRVNGELVTDRDSIQRHYDAIMQGIMSPKIKQETELMFGRGDSTGRETKVQTFGKAKLGGLDKLLEGSQKLAKNTASYDGSYQIVRDESYKMVVVDDDERLVYQAHLVQIGNNMFLDLYPLPEYSDAAFGENMFPVHTFMKLKLNGNKLDLTQFDLNKLNKLFKSNLIRLRHENVDGTILITAQPKELQKFLAKYSEDESVFDDSESYTRIIQ
ncbi:hypothetical protein [Roseivirga echinicomitans]|uniref:Lipoprotein n=1 Tax=Roseivirga echinicomitans TaxID=296218 RepID=A0A150XCW5_9BACT|nr:hypothetical protein [Roseivirga echinicomitans]KYG76579.1 hypothetical protein AWN68_05995 [Roseivirga echinicomitans]